jgi:hypothetical protein
MTAAVCHDSAFVWPAAVLLEHYRRAFLGNFAVKRRDKLCDSTFIHRKIFLRRLSSNLTRALSRAPRSSEIRMERVVVPGQVSTSGLCVPKRQHSVIQDLYIEVLIICERCG